MDLSEHIDSHYRKQLKTHEADYKRAYENQMQKVRKELAFLKMKKAEANGALMNDDRITSLRHWIQWFKIKSLELDAQLNKQKEKHKNEKMEEKNKVQSDLFLKNAVKESMKQNKALTNACKRQQEQNDKLKAFLKKNNISTTMRSSEMNASRIAVVPVQNTEGSGPNEFSQRIVSTREDKEEKAVTERDYLIEEEMIAVDDGGDQVDI